jgi:hypothetical protein
MEQKPEMTETEYWLTNGKFLQHRGKLLELARFLREIAFNEKSDYYCPTGKALANLNFFAGDLQVLVNKIVQLARDGHPEMAEEIIRGLERKNYLLPGEKLDDKAENYTLLMFDPEKTILLIRALSEGWYHDFDPYLDGRFNDRPLHPDTKTVFELFPTIRYFYEENIGISGRRKNFRHRSVADVPYILRTAYLHEVLSDFVGHFPKHLRKLNCTYPRVNLGHSAHRIVDDRVRGFINVTAVMIRGKRKNVLARFPRPLQERIASWQMTIPDRYRNDHLGWKIGLHEKKEHAHWRKEFPTFVAKGNGISNGLGAIFFPGTRIRKSFLEDIRVYGETIDRYQVYTHDWYDKVDPPFRILFQACNY